MLTLIQTVVLSSPREVCVRTFDGIVVTNYCNEQVETDL